MYGEIKDAVLDGEFAAVLLGEVEDVDAVGLGEVAGEDNVAGGAGDRVGGEAGRLVGGALEGGRKAGGADGKEVGFAGLGELPRVSARHPFRVPEVKPAGGFAADAPFEFMGTDAEILGLIFKTVWIELGLGNEAREEIGKMFGERIGASNVQIVRASVVNATEVRVAGVEKLNEQQRREEDEGGESASR